MDQSLFQCVCCDYFTMDESGASYEICPVCFWEQDTIDFDDPDSPSGANHGLTIREGRHNFAKYGCCEPRFVAVVLKPEQRTDLKREERILTLAQ